MRLFFIALLSSLLSLSFAVSAAPVKHYTGQTSKKITLHTSGRSAKPAVKRTKKAAVAKPAVKRAKKAAVAKPVMKRAKKAAVEKPAAKRAKKAAVAKSAVTRTKKAVVSKPKMIVKKKPAIKKTKIAKTDERTTHKEARIQKETNIAKINHIRCIANCKNYRGIKEVIELKNGAFVLK